MFNGDLRLINNLIISVYKASCNQGGKVVDFRDVNKDDMLSSLNGGQEKALTHPTRAKINPKFWD